MNTANVKRDFPIFNKKKNTNLVYLDSASTSQKPSQVINAVKKFYEEDNANVHRGVYALSERATALYEKAREKIAEFVGAKSEETIFVRNATEGLNLIANTFGKQKIAKGDVILLTEMEHHSNLVPWQMLAKEKNAKVEFVKINKNGELDLQDVEKKLAKAKLFSFTHVSNVLGTVNPVKEIVEMAKEKNVPVVLDAAQSVPHIQVNFTELEVDFAVFSGHKMLGPTGVGCVYGKKSLLEEMPPFMGGGEMIKTVTKSSSTWNDVPWKFEAGTPNIAGAIGLGAAIDYLQKIGMKKVEEHNFELAEYCVEELQKLPFVTIYGPEKHCGLVSFNVGKIHGHDVASALNEEGIAIRAGHHCCQPLMEALGVAATCRASFHVYNTFEDIDKLVKALKKCKKVFEL